MKKDDTSLRNLWFFDLATMLALLFMAVIMLRLETAKSLTNPTLTTVVSNDSSNFRMISGQVDSIVKKLPPSETTVNWYKQFQSDSSWLNHFFDSSSLILPKYYYLSKYKDLDEFSVMDTLISKIRESNMSYTRVIAMRDSLLNELLQKISIPIGEDVLKFPFNEAIPYPKHPITGKDLNQILQGIYTSVDIFLINKKYNVIKVVGHTDSIGTPRYNRELSQRRAEYLAGKIRQYLDNDKRYGPNKSFIVHAVGFGEFQPLKRDSRDTQEQYHQSNRRVELVFSSERFPYYQRN